MLERRIAVRRMFSGGRVTLPKEVRESLGLKPGDEVDFIPDGDGLIIVKSAPKPADSSRSD